MKESSLPTNDLKGMTIDGPLPSGTHEAFSSVVGSSIAGRKRLNTSFSEEPGLPQTMTPNKDYLNASSALEVSGNQDERRSPQSALSYAALQLFIDGALRLSVLSTINNKLIPGLKVKANTFESGLTDIAPSLWRPAYSSVGIEIVHSASVALTARTGNISTGTPSTNYRTFALSVIFDYAVRVKVFRREAVNVSEPVTVDTCCKSDARSWTYRHRGRRYTSFGYCSSALAVSAEDHPPKASNMPTVLRRYRFISRITS